MAVSSFPPSADDEHSEEQGEQVLRLIPVTGAVGQSGLPTLRVIDQRSAFKYADSLAGVKGVKLATATLRQLGLSCVQHDDIHLARHRTDTGWLSIVECRQFVTMFTLTPSNDRLGNQMIYAADPEFEKRMVDDEGRPTGRIAVPMPEPDTEYAQLVFTAPLAALRQAADANCKEVRRTNLQEDIGPDIIHRPLTSVFAEMLPADADAVMEQVTIDGNSRAASAYGQISISPDMLPPRLRKAYAEHRILSPSMLMACTTTQRRDLTRKIIKSNEDRLTVPATGTAKDVEERNAAVRALNALTAPVHVIVGYEDDEPETFGMSRFASAVRSLLVRMNVGIKVFDAGAQNAVLAEEIVLAAEQAGHFDEDEADLLIGRSDVTEVMKGYGFDPDLRDLRAMTVVAYCSDNVAAFNRVIREKNGKPRVDLKQRSAMASELILRSYGAVLKAAELERCRSALSSGCIWQSLVTEPWDIEVVNTDEDLDDALARALKELAPVGKDEVVTGAPGPWSKLLGVLGMITLVITGGLTSPKGSSEREVDNESIDRSSVASIIEKMIRFPWGLRLLAENVKRNRAGQPPMSARVAEGTTTITLTDEQFSSAKRDALLRLSVRIATQGGTSSTTSASDEENAFTEMCSRIGGAYAAFQRYKDIRSQDPSPAPLSSVQTDDPIKSLETMTRALNRMTADDDE